MILSYSITALSYFFFSTYFWAAASTFSRSIATTRSAPRLQGRQWNYLLMMRLLRTESNEVDGSKSARTAPAGPSHRPTRETPTERRERDVTTGKRRRTDPGPRNTGPTQREYPLFGEAAQIRRR